MHATHIVLDLRSRAGVRGRGADTRCSGAADLITVKRKLAITSSNGYVDVGVRATPVAPLAWKGVSTLQ